MAVSRRIDASENSLVKLSEKMAAIKTRPIWQPGNSEVKFLGMAILILVWTSLVGVWSTYLYLSCRDAHSSSGIFLPRKVYDSHSQLIPSHSSGATGGNPAGLSVRKQIKTAKPLVKPNFIDNIIARSTDTAYLQFEFPEEITEETVEAFAQFNPAVGLERERVKFMVKEVTESVSQNVILKDLFNSKVFFERANKFVSGRKGNGKEWSRPFITLTKPELLPRFLEFSEKWLGGDSDVINPLVMQDVGKMVKAALDKDALDRSSRTTSKEVEVAVPNSMDDLANEAKYRSCAVVGNSGVLLNGSYGEQIDSHELVIRLNAAETFGYERQVGTKTGLSFMNSNVFRNCFSRGCDNYGNRVPIIMYICQSYHMILFTTDLIKPKMRSTALVTPSHFDQLCAAIVKWYSITSFMKTQGRALYEWDKAHDKYDFHHSSGMEAVLLALGMCDNVDLYGFGKSGKLKHHYFTKQKEEFALHDYPAEYLFYDDLAHGRPIRYLSEANISLPPVRVFV